MRSRCQLLVLVLGLAAACERTPEVLAPSPNPTPIPTPATLRALVQPIGTFLFDRCTTIAPAFCAFNASLVNNGAGCAIRVEGLVRLFDRTGDVQLGGSYHFALPPQQIVQPGERVSYSISFVPFDSAVRVFSYLVDPLWIDTPCR